MFLTTFLEMPEMLSTAKATREAWWRIRKSLKNTPKPFRFYLGALVQHIYSIDVSQAAQQKQHAKRHEEVAWKRIHNLNIMQIFLLERIPLYNECNKNRN